jgi:hypothetical protein
MSLNIIDFLKNLENIKNGIYNTKIIEEQTEIRENKRLIDIFYESDEEIDIPNEIILNYELLNSIVYLTGMYFYDKNEFDKKNYYTFTSLELEYFYNSNVFEPIEKEPFKYYEYDIDDSDDIYKIKKTKFNVKITRELIDKKYKGKKTFKYIYGNYYELYLKDYKGIDYRNNNWYVYPDIFLTEFRNEIKKNKEIYGKDFMNQLPS